MRIKILIPAVAVALTLAVGVMYAQKEFRQYQGSEYDEYPLPPDYAEKTEFVIGRLMYKSVSRGFRRYSSWTIDYPRADRHLAAGLRRLTRTQVRSVEQPVSLDDDDDVYNWPFLYAVEVGHWDLTDAQAAKLRDYLLRGGFLMCDDFHGTDEWEGFMESMRKVFPDREVVDIESSDPIFHVLYDLDDKYQVPGAQYLYTGRTFERDGYDAHWRGVYDDKGRLMVALNHNMDLGDAWEWSDDPRYPEKWASLAYRIAVNYVVYALTH
ncbi:MAG: DUF4159 domain-containing protein [Acidobacteria bacterium]|nr:DUF4159 domain-containing protein [Acidobacteriota bacterium]